MKSLVAAEQETSLVSSLTTDEKLQTKPLPETIGLEKILDDNGDDNKWFRRLVKLSLDYSW